MTRRHSMLVLVPLVAAAVSAPAAGQSVPLPQTYSFLATTSLMSPEMQVKVNRVGSRELVELTLPGKGAGTYAMRQKLLYDFAGHRVYATDLLTKRCTVQEYSSSYAPMFDPIGGAEEMRKAMASDPPPVAGRELVNGIQTKVIQTALEGGQGTSRLWLDEKYGFVVRMAVGLGAAAPTTRVEIRQLSYATSPAALFAAPSGCSRIAGVSSAEGGHAETSIDVEVPLQTQQLETGKPSAARPDTPDTAVTPSPSAPEVSAPAPTQLTSVRLSMVPAHYRGPCPGKLELVGEFTTDGPGKVWYEFMAGAVSSSPEGTLTFTSAGTQTVRIPGAFQGVPAVTEAGLLGAMLDARGQHGPETVSADPLQLDIVCTKR